MDQSSATTLQHTPGPWRWDADTQEIADGISITTGKVVSRVATVHGWGPTYEANARLIATAPELLAQLKRAELLLVDADREWFGGNGSDNSESFQKMLAPIRAAIAKATGVQP